MAASEGEWRPFPFLVIEALAGRKPKLVAGFGGWAVLAWNLALFAPVLVTWFLMVLSAWQKPAGAPVLTPAA
jgi:hypothetical protein